MQTLTLTPEQIVDLIFEKIIMYKDTKLLVQESGIEILAKIEERLIHGRKVSSKSSEVCKYLED